MKIFFLHVYNLHLIWHYNVIYVNITCKQLECPRRFCYISSELITFYVFMFTDNGSRYGYCYESCCRDVFFLMKFIHLSFKSVNIINLSCSNNVWLLSLLSSLLLLLSIRHCWIKKCGSHSFFQPVYMFIHKSIECWDLVWNWNV